MIHIIERGIGHTVDVLGGHTKGLLAIHSEHLSVVVGKGHRLFVFVVLVRDDEHKGLVLDLGSDRDTGVDLVVGPQGAARHKSN